MVRFHPGEPRSSPRLSVVVLLMVLAAGLALVVDLWLEEPTVSTVPRQLHGVGQVLLVGWLYAAKPVLAALAVGVVVAAWRVRRRLALVAVVGILVPNVVVQLAKHADLARASAVGGLDPLSGHAALVSSVCLTWLALAPVRQKSVAAWSTVPAVAGVLLGVAAVWHSPAQLLVPLTVSAVVVLALVPAVPRDGAGRRTPRVVLASVAALCAVAAVALAHGVDLRAVPPESVVQPPSPAAAAVLCLATAAAVCAVRAAACGRGLADLSPPCAPAARDAPPAARAASS